MIEGYIIHLLIMICIFIVLSLSLNVALGYSGLLNLGHIAFYGIGMYTSAILVKAGYPFLVALIAAGIVPAVCSIFLLIFVRKLKGDYFAVATLGFTYVMIAIFTNWTSLTRGPLGIAGIPKPEIGPLLVFSNLDFLIFAFVIMVISTLIIWRVIASPFGRLMQASRDDALGLSVLGKNVFFIQLQAIVLSAFFAGIAGSLYAHYITFVDPGVATIRELVFVLTMVIVGGIATVRGSIIGVIVMFLLSESVRFIPYFPNYALGPAREMFYAMILIGILIWRPKGFFGRIDLK